MVHVTDPWLDSQVDDEVEEKKDEFVRHSRSSMPSDFFYDSFKSLVVYS